MERKRPAEMEPAGFSSAEILAVESPCWLVPGFAAVKESRTSRDTNMPGVRAVEMEPSLLGFSLHLLAVRKNL